MKRILRSIGYLLLSIIPLIAFYTTQLIAALILIIVYLLSNKALLFGTVYQEENIDNIANSLQSIISDKVLIVSIMSQVIALAVFLIWYILGWGIKCKKSPIRDMNIRSISGIIVLGFAVEGMISGILGIVECYIPTLMDEYNKLMEEAGLMDGSVLVLVTAVILAPIVEELIFRGITLGYARKISKHFWIANCIQALAFGIGHMNLIQGCYAFILGLIMGAVFKKYQTIYATMILHATFNFSGVFVGILQFIISLLISHAVYMNIVIILIFAMICVMGIILIKKDGFVPETSSIN